MYPLLRSALFRLEPETAHHITLGGLNLLRSLGLGGIAARHPTSDPRTVMGLDFPNPVGLAAGLDKNGDYIDGLAALGFGFIEIGTVTPLPQPGNPKPRLFRLPQAGAIINRMGFNNDGVDRLVENVRRADYRGILGINIGKNASTPIANAADDYLVCLRKVYAHASYITVNISSPNTKNLRQLQEEDALNDLLVRTQDRTAGTGRQTRQICADSAEDRAGHGARANRPDCPAADAAPDRRRDCDQYHAVARGCGEPAAWHGKRRSERRPAARQIHCRDPPACCRSAGRCADHRRRVAS